jgi:signal transduction histidine kinase/CheY-like chemotaxis protein
VELVRIAYRQLRVGTWITVAGIIAFGLLLQLANSPIGLAVWTGGMALPVIWSFWLARRFESLPPDSANHPRWGLMLILASTLIAAGWGTTPWVFPFLVNSGAARSAHLLLLAGLAISSVRVLLPMRKGSIAHIVAMMGPVALCYLWQRDISLIVVAAFVLLFMCQTIWTTLYSHRTLSDTIVGRFEREGIAAELRAENSRRESRESELHEARTRAESASRAKTEFLGTISHEIRTPMNGVLGMLRIVRDTELTPAQREYLDTASNSAEALLLLLNNVLDFSKIEANRLELERAPFSPATVARAVADFHHARARDRNLQFDLRLGEDLPPAIVGDAGRVRQILVNLIGNAIKFTERGRVEFTVECIERAPFRASLLFTVSDTGIGMDSAALERLFIPFSQADNSMSRRYGGSGLGLAISMRLTQAMGGSLQVQSNVGQGSTFRLLLPCALPEPALVVTRAEKPPAPRFVAPRLRGRVLVVEDDSINQQVIELFLKKLNLSLKFAGDGEAAISTATSEEFDLVLMDCQLPGIDGLEATRQIRTRLAGKPLKIVALTANVGAQFREACLAAGMDDYLSKPVRFELLAGMLQRHLPTA